jgi:hypothetical protein
LDLVLAGEGGGEVTEAQATAGPQAAAALDLKTLATLATKAPGAQKDHKSLCNLIGFVVWWQETGAGMDLTDGSRSRAAQFS